MMKREPDNLFWRENALIEQKLFDRIDNVLPKRYKKELKARILVPPSEQVKNDVAFSKRTRWTAAICHDDGLGAPWGS